MRKVNVYYGEVYAGQLVELSRGNYEFTYDEAFRADGSTPPVSVNLPKSQGLVGGLSPDIEKSDVYDRTGHPCRLDFERFAERIGLPKKRAASVLDMFMDIPQETYTLINHSFLNDKMKRTYKRIIEGRKTRFIRQSD